MLNSSCLLNHPLVWEFNDVISNEITLENSEVHFKSFLLDTQFHLQLYHLNILVKIKVNESVKLKQNNGAFPFHHPLHYSGGKPSVHFLASSFLTTPHFFIACSSVLHSLLPPSTLCQTPTF